MPTAMRIRATGGPEVLEVAEVDPGEPGPGQLLVDVAAAGVNYIDTYHRSGIYPLDLPFVLGMEGAGAIVAAAPSIPRTNGRSRG